jgi:hypothetical protein
VVGSADDDHSGELDFAEFRKVVRVIIQATYTPRHHSSSIPPAPRSPRSADSVPAFLPPAPVEPASPTPAKR